MHDIAVKERPSGHILLAEDHPVNQRVAMAMLEDLGFRVDVVADGAGAVAAAAMTPYQAILMDCQIPVLDGYQATAAIRAQEGSGRHTPIIAVTASATESDKERCLVAGMDDFLSKPLRLKTLAAVLARWTPDGSDATVVVDRVEALPAHVDGPARPVLDARVIDRLERLGESAGEDLMAQLAVLFLADADTSVVELREALAGDDAAAVVRSAHTLSGASANLGATDLARCCSSLATDGASGDLAGAATRFEAIEAELERVRSALDSRTPTP